jgi:hypothetical protein
MSVAYYIVLDNGDEKAAAAADGKAFARNLDSLEAIAASLDLPAIDSFVGFCDEDIDAIFEDDAEIPEELEDAWFPAEAGITLFEKLSAHIKDHPAEVKNAEGVLQDISDYLEILRKARDANAQWRFGIDI